MVAFPNFTIITRTFISVVIVVLLVNKSEVRCDHSSVKIKSDHLKKTSVGTDNVQTGNLKDVYEEIRPGSLSNGYATKDRNTLNFSPSNKSQNNEDVISKNYSKPFYHVGKYGGYYSNKIEEYKLKYFHGKYQLPKTNYYEKYHHKLTNDSSPLGYYLGFGLNFVRYENFFNQYNYTHYNIHYYNHNKITMLPEQYILSETIFACDESTRKFCPENTEAVCYGNGTVSCWANIWETSACLRNISVKCVRTAVPCISDKSTTCKQFVEDLELPCMGQFIVIDEFEGVNGMTLHSVAGTFVLSSSLTREQRTYCVVIVAQPSAEDNN